MRHRSCGNVISNPHPDAVSSQRRVSGTASLLAWRVATSWGTPVATCSTNFGESARLAASAGIVSARARCIASYIRGTAPTKLNCLDLFSSRFDTPRAVRAATFPGLVQGALGVAWHLLVLLSVDLLGRHFVSQARE